MWSDFLSLKDPPPYVIGSDEVGTGALAGPVVIAAVVYPFNWQGFPDLKDSKKYTTENQRKLRKEVAETVYSTSLTFAEIYILPEMIEEIGLHSAVMFGHDFVIKECKAQFPNSTAILDGNKKPIGLDCITVVKADSKVPAVSAASVLAKEERDWWMTTEAHQRFPVYGFDSHVGYSTERHMEALRQHGPCDLHRKNYRPIRQLGGESDRPAILSNPLGASAKWSRLRTSAGVDTTCTKDRSSGGR